MSSAFFHPVIKVNGKCDATHTRTHTHTHTVQGAMANGMDHTTHSHKPQRKRLPRAKHKPVIPNLPHQVVSVHKILIVKITEKLLE